MIHHMMVHPCIRFLVSNHNSIMLHAGSISKAGRSIIFTGTGGAGKTTLTSQLLADHLDIKPHSDDYCFLNQSNESLAYITRSHLYNDLIRRVPVLKERLSVWDRAKINLFSSIRKMSLDHIKWPTRVNQERLWPDRDYEKQAQIGAIIYVTRDNIEKPRLVQSSNIADYAHQLIEINFQEARYFIDLIEGKFGDDFLNEWLVAWKEREHRILVGILEKIPHFYLVLPNSIKNPVDIRERVNKLISPIIFS
jgi:GTPase SAR1 family protein